LLTKWKLFNRLKTKEPPQAEITIQKKENQTSEEKQGAKQTGKEQTEIPVKVYDETLYSKGSKLKQKSTTTPEKKRSLKRTSWENADTIEQNIDDMRHSQTESTAGGNQNKDNIEKKVDYILLKKKSKL